MAQPDDLILTTMPVSMTTAVAPPDKTHGFTPPMSMADYIRATYAGEWNAGGHDQAAALAALLEKQGITLADLQQGISIQDDTDYDKLWKDDAGNWWTYGAGSPANDDYQAPMEARLQRRLKIGDKAVGYLGDFNNDGSYGSKAGEYLQGGDLAAWSAAGDGNTSIWLRPDANGKLGFQAGWGSSSDADKIRKAATVVGGVLAAGYGLETLGAEAAAGYGGGDVAAAGVGEGTAGVVGTGGTTGTAGAVGSAGASGSGGVLGSWSGWGFDPSALVGSAGTGAASMGMGDWIQLANLGAGLWAAGEAGDRADANSAMMGQLANQQLAFSKEAFDWYKGFIEKQQPTIDAAAERAGKISDAQLEGMQFATAQAKELDAYNKATFRPIEQRLATEAAGYDTPERRAAAAASAAADIDTSAAATQQGNNRALARAGIAPGSAKALAVQQDASLAQSVARGGAMTKAVRDTEAQGYARMADVANLGRGIATQQATQQQIATSTGNASAGAAQQGVQIGQTPVGTMTSAVGAYTNGTQAAGNLFNNAAKSANDEYMALLSGLQGIGQFVGQRYGS